MQRTMEAFSKRRWDSCAYNYRGCSGEQNLAVKSYHSGFTEDLEEVLQYILEKDQYETIVLVGFSLGGNLVLKYAGEKGDTIHSCIKKVIGIGSPCDLQSSCNVIHHLENTLYRKSFVDSLLAKIKARATIIAESGIDIPELLKVKTLHEYDDLYTSQVHGFKDAKDYYAKASSLPYLSKIKIPALLINALNDTFLDEPSYPIAIAKQSKHLYLEMPKYGGHIGYLSFDGSGEYWIQQRILSFAQMDF